jgi:hypothetical protein
MVRSFAASRRRVETAAQRVAEELRQQYTLGFFLQDAGGKTYHRLTVMTRHADYRVRTRAGYLAAFRSSASATSQPDESARRTTGSARMTFSPRTI